MNKSQQYVALLRGINVGGNNIIKMVDLKKCFERIGLKNVTTYIQSGNVLFETSEKDLGHLTEKIEKALSKQFDYKASIVTVSHDEMAHTVTKAPKGFGSQPDKFRYDVIFLKAPVSPKEAKEDVPTKEGVDITTAGKYAFYFARLISKVTQSRISRIAGLPIYKSMTIRNWNTTTKLLAMMDTRAGMVR